MNRAGWDEEDVARLERHRLSFDLVLQRRPFENIDDFFPWMPVPRGRHARVEFNDRLDDLASFTSPIDVSRREVTLDRVVLLHTEHQARRSLF